MSGWVKIHEEWFERDEVEDLGAEAVMFHLSALAYSSRHLTDGVIPPRALRRLWPVESTKETVNLLVKAEWWTPAGDGQWILANWRDHILASDEVEHIREQTRTRVERHRRHNAGDHSLCDRCAQVRRNGVTNDATNSVSNTPSAPHRPAPPRTDREGGRGGAETAGERSAQAPRSPAGSEPESTRGATRAPHPDDEVWNPYALNQFAHPFHDDGNGKCALEIVDEGIEAPFKVCGEPPTLSIHGHQFIDENGPFDRCIFCHMEAYHPIHRIREDQESEAA